MDPGIRRRASVHYWMDKEREASRYYWAGVVASLLGVLCFALYPFIDWAGPLVGIFFLAPGISLILKWRRILMWNRARKDLWEDYLTEPSGDLLGEVPESETICVGSNGTHDNS